MTRTEEIAAKEKASTKGTGHYQDFVANAARDIRYLLAQNEAMAAALRSFALALEAEEQLVDELGEEKGYMVSLAFSREEAHKMAAALSDAGKGWVEVREQVREILEAIRAHEPKEVVKDGFAYDRMVENYRAAARAALDALKKGT